MRVGFVHGVMNTDNTTISGETIDYGPCAFMDHYDPQQVSEAALKAYDTDGDGRIAGAELDALGLFAGGVLGDTDRGTAVGQAEEQFHRRLETRQQAFERIGAGIGKRRERAPVVEYAPDETQGSL